MLQQQHSARPNTAVDQPVSLGKIKQILPPIGDLGQYTINHFRPDNCCAE
jgi:hypothetical protein